VLDYEPPGRIRTSIDYSHTPPGEAPLAWLRENGRYLTPTGSGDLFYVLALSLRNLLAVHFVIGLPLLGALALAVLLQVFLSNSALCSPAAAFLPLDAAQVLCGALWWVPGVAILIGVIPLILAFWMVYAFKSQDEPVHLINRATALYAVAALTFAALAIFAPRSASPPGCACWACPTASGPASTSITSVTATKAWPVTTAFAPTGY
ncbi:MAG: hypothetical protein ACN6QH_12215, partial [Pseudomonas sp.]